MRKIIFLLVSIFIFNTIYSQKEPLQRLNIKSPEVAEFEKYGNIPVDYYTGIPDITIPIYNVKSGDIELPISLKYHATAIKVDQEATWVGLNWLLNAGGVISTQVPKDGEAGTVNDWKELFESVVYGSFNQQVGNWDLQQIYKYAGSHESDWTSNYGTNLFVCENNTSDVPAILYREIINMNGGEAQLHSANFLNYSFKFIYHPIQQKFIVIGQDQKFVIQGNKNGIASITDPHGVKYYFTETETYTPADWGKADQYAYATRSVSYYLTKIESPSGRIINLRYKKYGSITPLIRATETAYSNYPGYVDGYVKRTLTPEYFIVNSYLYEIESDGVLVRFNVGSRTDMKGSPKKLDNIEIYDRSSNTMLKRFVFSYDYYTGGNVGGEYISDYFKESAQFFNRPYDPNEVKFTNDHIYKRLKLNKLTEEVIDEKGIKHTKAPYIFTYNPRTLPGKTSAARDFWGNYNGKENSGGRYYHILLSNLSYLGEDKKAGFPTSFKNAFPKADNRLDPSTVDNGLISTITYPTGGYDYFVFEPHKITNYPYVFTTENESWKATTSLQVRDANINSVMPDFLLTPKEFILTESASVEINVEVVNNSKQPWSNLLYSFAYLFKYTTYRNPDGSIFEYYSPIKQYGLTDASGLSSSNSSKTWTEGVNLAPGKYRLAAFLSSSTPRLEPSDPNFTGQCHVDISVSNVSRDLLLPYRLTSAIQTIDATISSPIPEDALLDKEFILTAETLVECAANFSINNNSKFGSWEEIKDAVLGLYKYIDYKGADGRMGEKLEPVKEWNIDNTPLSTNSITSRSATDVIGLQPGKYKIRATLPSDLPRLKPGEIGNNPTYHTVLGLKKVDGSLSGETIGEAVGVRIARIETSDNTNKSTVEYKYIENNISCGTMMNPLKFSSKKLMIQGGSLTSPTAPQTIPKATDSKLLKYWIQSSNNLVPEAENSIGYKTVQVIRNGDEKKAGKEIFTYWNKKNFSFDQFRPLKDPRNGKLLEHCIYDSNNKLLTKTTNTYKVLNTEAYFVNATIEDIYVGQDDYCGSDQSNPYFQSCFWGRAIINIYPSTKYWVECTESVKEEYTPQGTTSSKVLSSYNPGNLQLATKETLFQDNKSRIQYFVYPSDYNSLNYSYPGNLVSKNMINYPLEMVTCNNNSKGQFVISAGINKYSEMGKITNSYFLESSKELPLTDFRFSNKSANGLVSGNTSSYTPFTGYVERANYVYSMGNLLQFSKDGADNIVYLWSYNGQYPVAEIKNATFSEVNTALAALGLTSIDALSKVISPDINKLRELPTKLPNAMVSVYSYQPLVGILTATDPSGLTTYYDYDTFGRLKETYIIENGVKKVLQANQYHYQNQ